jgi:hypothetical protein
VTICTQGRRPFLGDAVGSVVHRSPIGDIAADEWRARAVGYTDFAWQPRFYDVIISDRRGLEAIRRYSAANPGRWHGGRLRRHHRSGRSI